MTGNELFSRWRTTRTGGVHVSEKIGFTLSDHGQCRGRGSPMHAALHVTVEYFLHKFSRDLSNLWQIPEALFVDNSTVSSALPICFSKKCFLCVSGEADEGIILEVGTETKP